MPLSKRMPLYPWICWLVVAVLYCLQYGLLALPSVLDKQFQASLAIDATEVGILYSAFLYTYVLMQIPVGLLFDRFRSRNLLFFAALLLALGCFVLAGSHHLFWAIIGRLMMGMGGSFAFIGALYLGRTWFPIIIFPLVVGLTEAMIGFSEIGLLPLVAYLSEIQHWRVILIEFAAIILILAALIYFLVKDRRRRGTKARSSDVRKDLKLIFRNPVMWLLSFYTGFIFTFVMAVANMWGVPLFQRYYHIKTWLAAIEVGMVMLGVTLGCFVIGWIVRYVSDRLLMLYCAAIQFVTILALWYFSVDLTTAGVSLFIIGFVSAAVIIVFDFAKKLVPASSYGVASGLLNMFFGGFGILITPLVGYIFETTKNEYYALLPVIVCSFLGVVVAIILNVIKIKVIPEYSQG